MLKCVVMLSEIGCCFTLLACTNETAKDPCVELGVASKTVVACTPTAEPLLLGEEAGLPEFPNPHPILYEGYQLIRHSDLVIYSDPSGKVLSRPKDGGQKILWMDASPCYVHGLAARGEDLLVSTACDVSSSGELKFWKAELWSVSGAGAIPTRLASHDDAAGLDITVVGDTLLWTTEKEEQKTLWALWRGQPASAHPEEDPIGADTSTKPIVLDDTVYFTVRQTGMCGIYAWPLWSDGSTRTVAETHAEGLFAASGRLYWTKNEESGDARSYERHLWTWAPGETSPRLAFEAIVPALLAPVEQRFVGVGFASPDGVVAYRVYSYDPDAYQPRAIAAALNSPKALVVDSQYAWFIDAGTKSYRVVRVRH